MAHSADVLVIGFSNGALILYDTLKNEVCYKTMSLHKNKKTKIDCLKTCTFQVRSNPTTASSSLAAGIAQNFHVNTAIVSGNRNARSL